jgi:hypothetical protein
MNARSRSILVGATGLGAVGVVASAFSAGAPRFWANWLVWFLFLSTLALGALFLVALEHLVGAKWSVPLRRIPERVSTLLIPLTPVALIALGAVHVLYPGSLPEALHHKVLAGKATWLGLPFFSGRVIFFSALDLVALAVLVRGSLKQDSSRDPQFNIRARRFAPLFMAIFALGVTQIAFDWISGLEPEWYSDIIGVYLFAGAFLAGLAATVLSVLHLQGQGRLQAVKRDHLYNLGGFLFAFTVFWSYIGFAQYMLMWYGDMPEEIIWYKARIEGPWLSAALVLAVTHFAIPFFALVTREAKGNPGRLRRVALLMLAAHWLDLYWLIFPAVARTPVFSWPELSFALLFLGSSLLWLQKTENLGQDMPVGDPFLPDGLEFRL